MGYFLQATGNRDLTVNLNIIFSKVKINNLHNLKYFKIHSDLDSNRLSNLTQKTVAPMVCLCTNLFYPNSKI